MLLCMIYTLDILLWACNGYSKMGCILIAFAEPRLTHRYQMSIGSPEWNGSSTLPTLYVQYGITSVFYKSLIMHFHSYKRNQVIHNIILLGSGFFWIVMTIQPHVISPCHSVITVSCLGMGQLNIICMAQGHLI